MCTMWIDIKYLTLIVLLLELPPWAEVGVMGFSITISSVLRIENFLEADTSCREFQQCSQQK